MRPKWIEHQGKRIFYQDFSGHSLRNAEAAKAELAAVQEIVLKEPGNSVLALADFTNTQVGKDLMDLMVVGSNLTKAHIKKTAPSWA